MPEIPVTTPKKVVAALKKLGFYEVRQAGSHLQLKRGNLLVTVPMHGRDLGRRVLKSILRQARISVEVLKGHL